MKDDILKVYATYYVAENDEFSFAKKVDMLNFIQHAEDSMIMDLFESGEIEPPMILDEVYLAPGLSWEDAKKAIAAAKKTKDALQQQYSDAKGAVKAAIQKKIDNANSKIDVLQNKLTGHGPKPESAGEKIASGAKELASQAKEKVTGAAEKVAGAVGKAAEFAQNNPGEAAAIATAVAAAATAGVMAYRRFISKAHKACKGSEDKKACMKEYHNKGVQAKISAMNAAKDKCFKTKNAEKCKSKIDVKIAGLKAKMKG